jgi:hypothetical protein
MVGPYGWDVASDAAVCEVFDDVPIFTVRQKRLFDADLTAVASPGAAGGAGAPGAMRRRAKMPPKYVTPPCGNRGKGHPDTAHHVIGCPLIEETRVQIAHR